MRAGEELETIRRTLEAELVEWDDRGELALDSGRAYGDGEPVSVRVRRREHRYTIDDAGAAVAKAGKPRGWYAAAEQIVAADWLNVNRAGIVFVHSVRGREAMLPSLALRIADASVAVYEALLELEDER